MKASGDVQGIRSFLNAVIATVPAGAFVLLTFIAAGAQLTGEPPTLSRHLAAAALGLGVV